MNRTKRAGWYLARLATIAVNIWLLIAAHLSHLQSVLLGIVTLALGLQVIRGVPRPPRRASRELTRRGPTSKTNRKDHPR